MKKRHKMKEVSRTKIHLKWHSETKMCGRQRHLCFSTKRAIIWSDEFSLLAISASWDLLVRWCNDATYLNISGTRSCREPTARGRPKQLNARWRRRLFAPLTVCNAQSFPPLLPEDNTTSGSARNTGCLRKLNGSMIDRYSVVSDTACGLARVLPTTTHEADVSGWRTRVTGGAVNVLLLLWFFKNRERQWFRRVKSNVFSSLFFGKSSTSDCINHLSYNRSEGNFLRNFFNVGPL
jgi:hypothetical protein